MKGRAADALKPAALTLPPPLQFQSDAVGTFSEALSFEAVYGEHHAAAAAAAAVALSATCDHPRLACDPRNVFFRTAKARPATPAISRQFISATGARRSLSAQA
jgi:hypothetical protein